MEAKFENPPLNDRLIITAEDTEEATELSRWHNCVVSTRFDYDYGRKPSNSILLLMKEI